MASWITMDEACRQLGVRPQTVYAYVSRKKVEACMIVKIDQTSAVCHAAMLRIKAERAAAGKR